MKIFIKNMVCQGTKLFVLHELERLDINFTSFELGEIELEEDLSLDEIKKLDESLRKYGLEVMFKKSKLVSRIREAVLYLVKNNITTKTSLSYFISQEVGHNYNYVNKYFTKETGLPIEEYFIEKMNEKLKLNEQTWSDVLNPIGTNA